MRRTVIVLIVATVLLWGSTALGRRSPTIRLDGDPDEYQAKAIHDETRSMTWDLARGSGGPRTSSRIWFEPGMPVVGTGVPGACETWLIWLRLTHRSRSMDSGGMLWEVLFPGRKQGQRGEGR